MTDSFFIVFAQELCHSAASFLFRRRVSVPATCIQIAVTLLATTSVYLSLFGWHTVARHHRIEKFVLQPR